MIPLPWPLLAHAGGWDEILIYGIPVLLALAGFRWLERRGRREVRPQTDQPDGDVATDPPSPSPGG